MNNVLVKAVMRTYLGDMITLADDTSIHLLEFINRRDLNGQINRLRNALNIAIVEGHSPIIKQLEYELTCYFTGELNQFSVSTIISGTPFQQQVWHALLDIPYGHTCSYTQIAHVIGQPNAYRAVARAISMNRFALIIPCHRVINIQGNLSGYAAGLAHKKWLLSHERNHKLQNAAAYVHTNII